MNATGRILLAPLTPAFASAGPNDDAVAAATIPLGASHAMNIRSGRLSVDPRVPNAVASGRITRIITAITPRLPAISGRTDAGVTDAEISTNSTPIMSWTTLP